MKYLLNPSKKLLFLTILFMHPGFVFSAENDSIRRTIAILPFINQSLLPEYNYLSDTIRDALKSRLVKSDQFLLTDFSKIGEIIMEKEISPNEVIGETDAKDIAVNVKSDIVITGKYMIINEDILVQIDAFDIFTGRLIDSSSIKGGTGLDVFRIVDEVTNDMSAKLIKKLQKVDKSYFDVMNKLMKKQIRKEINNVNKAGIGLMSSGGTMLAAGIIIFTVDNTYVLNKRNSAATYKEYDMYYNTDIALFSAGLSMMITGGSLCAVSIPLLIYKKKKLGFNVKTEKQLEIYFGYQF